MKVVMEARNIPEGQRVGKSIQNCSYTLKREIKIYKEDSKHTIIKAEEGTVFLVRGDSISAVSEDKEIFWELKEEELLEYLEDLIRL